MPCIAFFAFYSVRSESLYMPSKGLGEMFEGYYADMNAQNILLASIGGVDTGVRTPIRVSGICLTFGRSADDQAVSLSDVVATIIGIILLSSSSFRPCYFSPRRGCRRVLKQKY
jgi:hypothetical protein